MPELDLGLRLISCYAERALKAKRRGATAADSCRRPQPEGRSGILQLEWHTGSSIREDIAVIWSYEAWWFSGATAVRQGSKTNESTRLSTESELGAVTSKWRRRGEAGAKCLGYSTWLPAGIHHESSHRLHDLPLYVL